MSEKRFIYVDNAATTKVDPAVKEVMTPYFENVFGNPSSLHTKGNEAALCVIEARRKIAEILECRENEIYFTSGGTESDNWAIKGAAYALQNKGKHIITSKIEHHAVMHTMEVLEKEGFEITYLDVDADGFLTADDVEKAIREDTILVAIMYANNEIGTILPIKEIAAVCKKHGVLSFTDAVQAVGNIPVSIKDLGVDMLSFSGHKIHAPKGIGALYIRNGVRIKNLIDGGGQEKGRRSGTENTAYIAALAKALELSVERLSETEKITAMRDKLINELLAKIPYTKLNGPRENRLPGNVNIAFEFIEGESMLLMLDANGICASSGSACASASLDPSHVLLAIGLPHEKAHGSLRLSLSYENTMEEIDYIIEKLPPIVERLRMMSPIYEG